MQMLLICGFQRSPYPYLLTVPAPGRKASGAGAGGWGWLGFLCFLMAMWDPLSSLEGPPAGEGSPGSGSHLPVSRRGARAWSSWAQSLLPLIFLSYLPCGLSS